MEIAIKGDKENGYKIIKYFKSLGVLNKYELFGEANCYYFAATEGDEGDFYDNIIDTSIVTPDGYEVYESWSEFENKYLNKIENGKKKY